MGGGLRGGVQSCYCLPSVNTTHHTTSTMADTEPTTVEEVQVSRPHYFSTLAESCLAFV